MKYSTRNEIEATGVNMKDMDNFLFGQTGGIVKGEFVSWTHDVNRYLRHVGIEEIEGTELSDMVTTKGVGDISTYGGKLDLCDTEQDVTNRKLDKALGN